MFCLSEFLSPAMPCIGIALTPKNNIMLLGDSGNLLVYVDDVSDETLLWCLYPPV